MPNFIDVKQLNQNKLSGFFVESIYANSGIFLSYVDQELNNRSALLTGDQNISGIKSFSSRPQVNGTGVLLIGEAVSNVDFSGFYPRDNPSGFITGVNLSNYVTRSNGQFIDRPTVNGTGILLSGDTPSNINLSDYYPRNNPSGFITGVNLSNYVTTTGRQNVSGSKTFLDTAIFKQDIILSGAESNGIYFDNFYKSPYIKYYAGYENTLEIRNPGGSPGILKLINGQQPEGNGPEYGQKIILDGDTSEISYDGGNHYFYGGPVWAETIIPQNIIAKSYSSFLDPTALIKITGKLKVNDSLTVSSLEGRTDISGNMALELKAGSNKILIEKEDGGAIIIQSQDINFSTIPTVSGTKFILSGDLNNQLSNLVKTTGDQIISGNKTFVNNQTFSNNINVSGTGIFNALNLNNIDNLYFSGVDIVISKGSATIENPILVPLTGAPQNPLEGQLYFNSQDKNFYGFNGISWVRLNN